MSSTARLLGAGLLAAFFAVPVTPSLALTQDEISNLTGPERQKILEEGARKEGEITWYSTSSADDVIRPMDDAFMKKYPFIKVNYITITSAQFIQRAQAEKQARSVRVDVAAVGAIDQLSGTGLLQKFSSPVLADFPKSYVDPRGEWAAYWVGWQGIAWNTKLVSEAEAPKTWEDLANLPAKFKGKIAWPASAESGGPRVITHLRQIWGEERALAWAKKMAELDVRTSSASGTALLDQVAVGEYAFNFGATMHILAKNVSQGQPLYGVNPNPAIVRTSGIGIMKDAPHPHAAILFVDFVTAADGGQVIMRNVLYNPANPKLDPLPAALWASARAQKIPEAELSGDQERSMLAKTNEIFKTYFRGG